MKTQLILLFSTLALTISPAFAALDYTGGHADIDVHFEDLAWHVHLHAEGADIGGSHDIHGHMEPDAVRIVVPDHAEQARPVGSQWDFLGLPEGGMLWILPQHAHGHGHHHHDNPHLGIGAEHQHSGVFVNDLIVFSLAAVDGPGHFSVWQDDAFGDPIVYMSSFDPDATVALLLNAGGHAHFNWGFSAEGTYHVTFLAVGVLLDGEPITQQAMFTFHVIPEPATLLLLIPGVLALKRRM